MLEIQSVVLTCPTISISMSLSLAFNVDAFNVDVQTAIMLFVALILHIGKIIFNYENRETNRPWSRTLKCSRGCHFRNFLSQVIPAYSSLKITLLIQSFFIQISEINGTEKRIVLSCRNFFSLEEIYIWASCWASNHDHCT